MNRVESVLRDLFDEYIGSHESACRVKDNSNKEKGSYGISSNSCSLAKNTLLMSFINLTRRKIFLKVNWS